MHYIEAIETYQSICDQERNDQKIMLAHIAQYGDQTLSREQQLAHFTSSSIILNEEMTHMLMIHHNIYNTWTWTGGHMDSETDFLKVALKEASEETGLTQLRPLCESINSLDILPVWGHVKRGAYVSAHLHLNASFVLIAPMTEALSIKPDENSDIKWVPFEAVNAHSNEPDIIAVYNKLLSRAGLLLK